MPALRMDANQLAGSFMRIASPANSERHLGHPGDREDDWKCQHHCWSDCQHRWGHCLRYNTLSQEFGERSG